MMEPDERPGDAADRGDPDDPRERRRRGEGGSSDDDRQPDDTGATGTLGDEGGGTDLNP